jgi:hypothetical protein
MSGRISGRSAGFRRQWKQGDEAAGEHAVARDAQRALGFQPLERLSAVECRGQRRRRSREDQVGIVRIAPPDSDSAIGEMGEITLLAEAEADVQIEPLARRGSSMVRSDSSSEAALNGKVGSCLGERAPQRPSA